MPAPPSPDLPPGSGPQVGEHTVTFRVADPAHRLRSVRLYQEVRLPGDLLGFRYDDDDAADGSSTSLARRWTGWSTSSR